MAVGGYCMYPLEWKWPRSMHALFKIWDLLDLLKFIQINVQYRGGDVQAAQVVGRPALQMEYEDTTDCDEPSLG